MFLKLFRLDMELRYGVIKKINFISKIIFFRKKHGKTSILFLSVQPGNITLKNRRVVSPVKLPILKSCQPHGAISSVYHHFLLFRNFVQKSCKKEVSGCIIQKTILHRISFLDLMSIPPLTWQ